MVEWLGDHSPLVLATALHSKPDCQGATDWDTRLAAGLRGEVAVCLLSLPGPAPHDVMSLLICVPRGSPWSAALLPPSSSETMPPLTSVTVGDDVIKAGDLIISYYGWFCHNRC